MAFSKYSTNLWSFHIFNAGPFAVPRLSCSNCQTSALYSIQVVKSLFNSSTIPLAISRLTVRSERPPICSTIQTGLSLLACIMLLILYVPRAKRSLFWTVAKNCLAISVLGS